MLIIDPVHRDRRGRRRVPGQERGLRPLHPALPPAWLSRAIRVSMPIARWLEFDALVSRAAPEARTAARAAGHVVATLLDTSHRRISEPHWLDFERDKAQRLLGVARVA